MGELHITPGQGHVYMTTAPTCPTHKGPLRLNLEADRWECCGYDGEGCAWTRPPGWTPLGTTAEPVTIRNGLGAGEQWAKAREEYL